MVKVFMSRRPPQRVRDELESSFELDLHQGDEPLARAELLARCAGRDGLVLVPSERVDDELLAAAGPQLRAIAVYAVGYDNVDVEAATRRGVVVTNTPDVLTRATAELTLGLLLSLVRRVAEGDRFLRAAKPWGFSLTFMLGHGLDGRTLGIVGPGRIGREVGRLAEAFGMRVVYAARSDHGLRWPRLELDELLATADAVSLHCPLSEETRHLIDADALARMRPDAVLVNTTRGPVVDERALVAALERGELAGAALDVFEREPEVEEGLLRLENVVLTPHIGSATHETREAMGLLCVEGLRAVLLEQHAPANALNPAALRL